MRHKTIGHVGECTVGKAERPATKVQQITREQIERRAYEIYASRGYVAGDPLADWREAERQLRTGEKTPLPAGVKAHEDQTDATKFRLNTDDSSCTAGGVGVPRDLRRAK